MGNSVPLSEWDPSLWLGSPAVEAVLAGLLALDSSNSVNARVVHCAGMGGAFVQCGSEHAFRVLPGGARGSPAYTSSGRKLSSDPRRPYSSAPPPATCLPQAFQELSLTAPFVLLERLVQLLGRFTGLKSLRLQAWMFGGEDEDEEDWEGDPEAVLRPALLRQLPPQLESLEVFNFCAIRLEQQPAPGEAASGATPAGLLPGLTELVIEHADRVMLDVPLPSLAALAIYAAFEISLASEGLHLPQLTSLHLPNCDEPEQLRCGAMPALARLVSECSSLAVSNSFAALQHLTHLRLSLPGDGIERTGAWLASVSTTLRSLSLDVWTGRNGRWARAAARAAAAAGLTRITQLVGLCVRFTLHK